MDKIKIALIAVVALLLGILVIALSRLPEQMGELDKKLGQLNGLLSRGVAPTAVNDTHIEAGKPAKKGDDEAPEPAPPVDPVRDGNPKLGVNFLLPYDGSHYRPEWQGGTLRSFVETPKGLNSIIDNSATAGDVQGLCNDSLCDRGPRFPELWSATLAESVLITDDYKTYTFTIRKGVKWTRAACASQPQYAWLDKDVELTADDFVFLLDMIMDPAVDCPQLRNYYEDLESWTAIDPYTLQMRWKKKVYTSLAFSLGISPLPRHIYGCDAHGGVIAKEKRGVAFNKHWFDEMNGVVGVGAFILDNYQSDKVMAFRRNPNYWAKPPMHFDRLEWNMAIKEPDPQFLAFRDGQVHSHGLTPSQYKTAILDHKEQRFAALDPQNPKAGRAGELGWERVKGMSFSYIGWNMQKPPFDDRRVRQAMSYALPKERIISEVFYGLGRPVLSDVHPDSQYCNHDLKPYDFDLQHAKKLLAEAGWTDSDGDGILDKEIGGRRVPLSFEVKYIAHRAEYDNLLLIYHNELHRIGVDLKPASYEWKELLRILEDKDFDAVISGWQMDLDIDFYQLWHSSQVDVQNGSNHCGFKNKRVDELVVKLRETFVTSERIAIAKEVQAIIHEEQPYTFFRSGEGIFVWQNHPPEGSPVEKERWLAGVIKGLDTFHPLRNRANLYWHFRD